MGSMENEAGNELPWPTSSSSAAATRPSPRPTPRRARPKVLLLEKAPKELSGGNSFYTAGATRIAHNGLEDLQRPHRSR